MGLHMTPTVLRAGPYRFFFYSGDRLEPPHVPVERDTRRQRSGSVRFDLNMMVVSGNMS